MALGPIKSPPEELSTYRAAGLVATTIPIAGPNDNRIKGIAGKRKAYAE